MMISVVIPSYNGAKHLPIIMEALRSQKRPADEVIVVLDGSTDGSDRFLKSVSHEITLRVVKQDNKGRSAARNRGVAEARGDLIVCFDDDVLPASDSLNRHEVFHTNNTRAILGGAVLEDPECTEEICLWRNWLHSQWVGSGLSIESLTASSLVLSAANLSLSKKLFDDLSGFDEGLRDCEDFDLAARAFSEKIPIYYDPSNKSFHRGFESLVEYAKRQREYRDAYEQLVVLRQNTSYSNLYLKYKKKISFSKSIIYFFVPGKGLNWIDKGYLNFLPRKLKFVLTSRLFAALTVYYPNRIL